MVVKDKYKPAVTDSNSNGIANTIHNLTVEEFYDLIHHTHKASDIIGSIDGSGLDENTIQDIENIKTSLEKINKIDTIESNITSMKVQTDKVSGIDTRVGSLETKLTDYDTVISDLDTAKSDITNMKTQTDKISSINTKVGNIETKISDYDTIKSTVESLKNSLSMSIVDISTEA